MPCIDRMKVQFPRCKLNHVRSESSKAWLEALSDAGSVFRKSATERKVVFGGRGWLCTISVLPRHDPVRSDSFYLKIEVDANVTKFAVVNTQEVT